MIFFYFATWNTLSVSQIKSKRSDAQKSRLRGNGALLVWSITWVSDFYKSLKRGTCHRHSWVLPFNLAKWLNVFSSNSLLTSPKHTQLILCSSRYSSTKCSPTNCLQKATILRRGEAGSKLYIVTIEACSAHCVADKWQKSKYLKSKFSWNFLFLTASSLPRPQIH